MGYGSYPAKKWTPIVAVRVTAEARYKSPQKATATAGRPCALSALEAASVRPKSAVAYRVLGMKTAPTAFHHTRRNQPLSPAPLRQLCALRQLVDFIPY